MRSWLTNPSCNHKEIKYRFKAGNSYYYSVQIVLSSRFFSNNLKIKIYKTIIFSVVLYGWETCYPTLREEHRLRAFENQDPEANICAENK